MAILTQMIEAVSARLDCLIMGNWGQRAHPDHVTAVDATVGRGFIDADRLRYWERSRGGFATFWIVGRTSRFKAPVAEASIENLRRAQRDVDFTTELFRIAQMVVAPGSLSVLGREHS